MSDALDSLEKLTPAPSSRTFQYYRPHYECIRGEILRLREKCRELQAWKDAIDEELVTSVQIGISDLTFKLYMTDGTVAHVEPLWGETYRLFFARIMSIEGVDFVVVRRKA